MKSIHFPDGELVILLENASVERSIMLGTLYVHFTVSMFPRSITVQQEFAQCVCVRIHAVIMYTAALSNMAGREAIRPNVSLSIG
jgi:hypothetical protein